MSGMPRRSIYVQSCYITLECAACVTRSSWLDLAGRSAVKHRERVNHCPNNLPILLANLVFSGEYIINMF